MRKNMRIKSILLALFVLTMIISPASAGVIDIQVPEWLRDIFSSPEKLQLYVNPGGTIEATVGETLSFEVLYYNQYSSDRYFRTRLDEVEYCGSDIGAFIYTTGPTLVAKNQYQYKDISLTAPSSPGTYIYSFMSFQSETYAHSGIYDEEVCVTLIVSSETPTGTATATATSTATGTPTATATAQPSNIPPVARITYENMGNGKLVLRGTESTDQDGTIEEYKWHLNDQYINGQSTFTHVFDEAGTSIIRLDVIDNDGGSSSATLIVQIHGSDNAAGVVIGDIDDTQAVSQPAAGASGSQQPRGIWIEDGALMMPGFEALFAIAGLIMVYWNVHRRREE